MTGRAKKTLLSEFDPIPSLNYLTIHDGVVRMSDTHLIIGNVTIESFIIFTVATIAVIFLAYLCYKAVYTVLERFSSRSVARWTARFTGYIIFGIGLYYIDLTILGFDISATFASLGILSIALAFASQQIISNLLAGLLIAINRTIALDDWIELGNEPETGIAQVLDMTFTRTILKDRDGRVFLLPNATLLSSKIVNYSRSGYIEIPVTITLPPGLPFAQARDTILSVLTAHPKILPNIKPENKAQIPGLSMIPRQHELSLREIFPEHFSSRVLLSGLAPLGNTVSIRFWIGDITHREEIVSDVLHEIGQRLGLIGKS
jgi:small-conductance mechanosensitive channel